jgi:hypothetical protein
MVPSVHERAISWSPRAALAAAVLLCILPFPVLAEPRDLARVVYEFAVTGYCGLAGPAVEAGFHAELAALTARGRFDAESARHQRINGWVAAEREWRNRGLGGNRAWCAGEGAAAASRFQAIAEGRLQP